MDRPGIERSCSDAASGAATGPRAAMLLTGVLTALAALWPVVNALQTAARATTVWEDRALHALSPASLPVLGGVGLGVLTVLLVTSCLLDGARRLGAEAVVETRAAMLESAAVRTLDDLPEMVRRAVLPALVVHRADAARRRVRAGPRQPSRASWSVWC